MQNNIIIINGPNINLLGDRDKEIYGKVNYEDLLTLCKSEGVKKKIKIDFYQSNIEGEIVTKILLSNDISFLKPIGNLKSTVLLLFNKYKHPELYTVEKLQQICEPSCFFSLIIAVIALRLTTPP